MKYVLIGILFIDNWLFRCVIFEYHKKQKIRNKKYFQILDVEKYIRDVTLVCIDGALDAHKLILTTASLFFRRALPQSKVEKSVIYLGC